MKFISINRNYRKIGTIGNTEKKKKKNRGIERVKIERTNEFFFFSFLSVYQKVLKDTYVLSKDRS